MKSTTQHSLSLLCLGVCLAFSKATFANIQAPTNAALPAQAIDKIPDGRLKKSLSKLPPTIQQKVLDKLQTLGTPAIDTLLMDTDADGELFYVEEGLVSTDEIAAADNVPQSTLPAIDVFNLNSKPDSANTLFLDFDGGQVTGKAWGSGATYETLAYDLDGNPSDFNDNERARIHEIWVRIADDFSAFDVNVTTKAPSSFGPNTGWLLFTKDTDAFGNALPSQGAGGVAYVGVWGRSNYSYYQPAFVYYNRLGSGTATYMAEAGSHEAGHNLGLSHDGTSTESYYRGLGADNELSSWAPIMGVGYAKNVTQWSKGEYPDANQLQDDIAIITGKLGASSDTEGSMQSPSSLIVDSNGQFSATNRQLDPGSAVADNKGTVQVGDSDWFQVSVGTGAATFTATPAWGAFSRSTRRGANLDIGLNLYDALGQLVATGGNDSDTKATIQTTLAEGIYTLEVFGTAGPYVSNYGSQGHFYLAGQVAVASPDITPPDPNPMTFTVAPHAISDTEISMQAEEAIDDRGGVVSYQFTCLGNNCSDSAWQSSTSFTASGLSASNEYCFNVYAKDLSGNVTTSSALMCATTLAPKPLPEPPHAPSSLSATDGQNGQANLLWLDNSDNETRFEVQRETLHKSGRWQSQQLVATLPSDTNAYADASGVSTFRYRVRAANETGSSAWSNWAEVTVTNQGGGGVKPCKGKSCGN